MKKVYNSTIDSKKFVDDQGNSYYLIDSMSTPWGLFELWEDDEWGDEVPAVVTKNGVEIDSTYDSLYAWYQEYSDIYHKNIKSGSDLTSDYAYRYASRYELESRYQKYAGVEDDFFTDDWSDAEMFAHEKLSQGNWVEITDNVLGKSIIIDPDWYNDTFEERNGEFPVNPWTLEFY